MLKRCRLRRWAYLRADQQFVANLKLIGESKPAAVDAKYEMLTGKWRLCENFGVEKTFNYQNVSKQSLNITFRVYNDGIAFRYAFPNRSVKKGIVIGGILLCIKLITSHYGC
jgi:predicted nucleic acid binding AN1-type Zn finger protein